MQSALSESRVNDDKFVLFIQKDIEIAAPLRVAYDATIEEISTGLVKPDGTPMPMQLEMWPGGRYLHNLGNNAGHFWGHVQVIKPPTLLEITGPLFMSYAVVSHVQYRLEEHGRNTVLTLTHRAFGEIHPEHRSGVHQGWQSIIEHIRDRAQR